MTHYALYCPICGQDSVARVNGMPTDLSDGYTYHSLDGYSFIHEAGRRETQETLSSRTDTHGDQT